LVEVAKPKLNRGDDLMLRAIVSELEGFSNPFKKYVVVLIETILALRGRLNFTNLERQGGLSARTHGRWHRRAHPFREINREIIRTLASGVLLLAMDASFIRKSGKATPGLGRFWNGTAGRSELGLEVSLVSVVEVEAGRAFALDARQNLPAENDGTAIDAALAHFLETKSDWPQSVAYAVFDGWYAKKTFVDGVLKAGLHMIGKLRKDADLRYLFVGPHENRRGRRLTYVGKVKLDTPEGFTHLGEFAPGVEWLTAVVYHVTFKRNVRVVLIVDRTKAKAKRVLLFCTDTTLDAALILEYYQARFHIEFLFRDAKQFAGLQHCQSRNDTALDFHFNASFCAVNVAKAEADANVFSMASHKARAFNDLCLKRIIATFGIDPQAIQNHPNYENFRNWGTLAA
jgi:hypothetical protein